MAAEPITDIDTTAGAMLADLDLELNAAGIHLTFAELQSDVREAIVRYGLLEIIDLEHLYPSVTEAVKAFRREVVVDGMGSADSDDDASLATISHEQDRFHPGT